MPRGVYPRTQYHKNRLRGHKAGKTGCYSRIGHCLECEEEAALYRVEIKGMNPRKGLKYNWVCLPCARRLHEQGKLNE